MSNPQGIPAVVRKLRGGVRSATLTAAARWRIFSLATQFAVVAALVIGLAMAVLGTWVASRIEAGVIHHTALAAALYMDRFVEPYVQELASNRPLSENSRQALAALITKERLGKKVIDVKVWQTDGTVVYSGHPELLHHKFPLTGNLERAMRGDVVAEFDELDSEENVLERAMRRHILEIYAPIREIGTERVIAVAEFYQLSDQLASELAWARLESVGVVGCLALLMLGALFGIVRRGSSTIIGQQHALSERVAQLSRLLKQNNDLRQRVEEANRRSAEGNERFLRRVSAELHDGPVQLIGLVLLRLDTLNPAQHRDGGLAAQKDYEIIRGALNDALTEIRDLSHGMALPELEKLSFAGSLDLAISNHERRTSTAVEASIPEALPTEIPCSIKTCAYRFVQEGLNNAFRHAGGAGQRIEVSWNGAHLAVEVSDEGPGMNGHARRTDSGGLGLAGLRDRIVALGGTMNIVPAQKSGTKIRALFPLIESED